MSAYPANTDLVVQTWLSSLSFLNSGMVGADLPEAVEQNASLVTSGFVTAMTVGGTPEMYVPLRQPVVQIDSWAFPIGSSSRRPRWADANALAERIVKACYDTTNFNKVLEIPKTGYPAVMVKQGHPLQEPRRGYSDRGYFAIFRFDLQLYWIEVPTP